jgi:hypothetical protein
MMLKATGVVWLALAVGCVAPETPEPDQTNEVEQHIEPCPGCGGNGMRQGEWNYVFGTLEPSALGALWDGDADSPRSLCKPYTNADGGLTCALRDGWKNWLGGEPQAQRKGIFRNLVKIILPKNHYVKTSELPDDRFEGKFGLMTWARDVSWGQAGREIATAGMLALLSAVPDVAICLNTKQLPYNCTASGMNYSESITFGDAIYGSQIYGSDITGIWGSAHAPKPLQNARYGTVAGGSASVYNNALNTCNTATTAVSPEPDAWSKHYPTYCRMDGITWHNPVHVLTPQHPQTWYYGDPAAPSPVPVKPSSWPNANAY